MSVVWGAGALLLTDACVPLIEMYRAYQAGWRPPTHVITKEERDAALTLPDSDPLKAFLRFGCGFGGDWAGSVARDAARNYARETAENLSRTFSAISGAIFEICDFNAEPVDTAFARDLIIYCDPPYRGTEGYAAVGSFDHDLFEERARAWAFAGAEVYVSEFEFPGKIVLEFERAKHMPGQGVVRERLFRV